MTDLPNPFQSATCPQVAEQAAASPFTPGTVDAAADQFDELEIPLEELTKRGFDVEAFMDAIEPLPLFLQAPLDVLNVLAAY